MAKDLGGFLKSFAGSLGSQMMGGPTGLPIAGMLGQDILGLGGMGKSKKSGRTVMDEDNPGMKMFGVPAAANEPNFGQRFLSGMQDQLFQNAMTGFMKNGLY